MWLRRMDGEIGFNQNATKVNIANLSAKALACAQMTKTLTKQVVRKDALVGRVDAVWVVDAAQH